MPQDVLIALDGCGGQVARSAVIQIRVNGFLKHRCVIHWRGQSRDAAIDFVEASLSLGPATGLQRALLALAVFIAPLHPNRTGAFEIANALALVRATFFVASFEGVHASTISPSGDVIGDAARAGLESAEKKKKKLAVRVGFEPTEPAKVQRFSRPPDSTTLAPHRIFILPEKPPGECSITGG